MTEAELKAYIEQGKAHGMTPQQMREALVGTGWNAATVDAALGLGALVVPMTPPAPPSPAAVGGESHTRSVTVQYASFWRKFFSVALDMLLAGIPTYIVMAAYSVLIFVTPGGDTSVGGLGSVASLLFGLIGGVSVIWILVYRPWLEGTKGATWGMRILGLRIVREDEPSRVGIGFWLPVGRSIVSSMAGGITAQISTFWMLMDSRRRHAADLICKTVVLHDPSKAFAFPSLDAIPSRKKRVVWFAILALLGAASAISSIGGAASSGN